MTNLAIVSMVRNECDIIELFIKINSRHAKMMVVVDHMSDDGTSSILEKMSHSVANLRVLKYDNPSFQQSQVMTQIVQQLAHEGIVDYIVPLDADEFLASTQPEFDLIKAIPSLMSVNQVGLIPWQTYCPVSIDYFDQKAPLFTGFKKRSKEPVIFSKLIIGREYAKKCTISEGNHIAYGEGLEFKPIQMPFSIQHVPVRTVEQIISKAIIGSYQLVVKENRRNGEGFHWDVIAKFIRDKNYLLSIDDLQSLALNYGQESKTDDELFVDLDAPSIGTAQDAIDFLDFARPNSLRDLDRYIDLILRTFGGKKG